jgi:hypothetical protein
MARGGLRSNAGRKPYGTKQSEHEVLELIESLRSWTLEFAAVASELSDLPVDSVGMTSRQVDWIRNMPAGRDGRLSSNQIAHILNKRGFRNRRGGRFTDKYVAKLIRENNQKC